MSSSWGENIRLTIFGQSHSKGIGMTLEGITPGSSIDFDELHRFLERRAPGKNDFSTSRKETDRPEFISGLVGNRTCGTPIAAIIMNADIRSKDYEELRKVPRPGHADFTAYVKYGESRDYKGGGHFSGRLTAPLCIAGGIVKQLLSKEGIEVISRIYSIGGIKDEGELISSTAEKAFPVVNDECGERMRALIAAKKAEKDSVGGVVECIITGLPAGIGDPMFDGMENRIASIVFGIPAVKGIEFGNGFACAALSGSENNDEFCVEGEKIKTKTNNCGGILGGITNGMPLIFRAAFKPTPSIEKEQISIDLESLQETKLKITGRHDPCIVPRAAPVVEAAAALAVYDALLGSRKR